MIFNGLVGAELIIYNAARKYPGSTIAKIADLTCFHYQTAWRKVRQLEQYGIVSVDRETYPYSIKAEDTEDVISNPRPGPVG